MTTDSLHTPVPLDPREAMRRQDDIVAQEAFKHLVENVRKSHVGELPDLTPGLNHAGQLSPDIAMPCQTTGEQVLLSPNFYTFLGKQTLPDRVEFTPNSLMRIGKEDSRKQVFFGPLHAQWFSGSGVNTGAVAIKPIHNSEIERQHSFQEVAMYQHLEQLGIPTLNVLGVAMLETPREKIAGFMMTQFTELTTLDTVEWDKLTPEETRGYVDHALEVLATLHGHLIFHGDAVFRNIGVVEEVGRTRIVDMEHALSLGAVPDNVPQIAKRMSGDLARLTQSVQHYVVNQLADELRPTDDIARFNFMHNYVYEPYYEKLLHADTQHADALQAAYGLMLRDAADRAAGRL